MKRHLFAIVLLGLGAVGLCSAGLAAVVESITPVRGMVGSTAVIHGSGFLGTAVRIEFGRVTVDSNHYVIIADTVIKMTIPNKDPLDPNPVPVTVVVDGQPAQQLSFEYNIPLPSPVITSFDPARASSAAEFTVTFQGSDFTNPQGREPMTAYLVNGPKVVPGTMVGPATSTSFSSTFPAGVPAGDYQFFIGFSDASSASIAGFAVF